MKILIVEDNMLAAMAVKLKLVNATIAEIIVVNSANDAIREFTQNNFDLIIMDIGLVLKQQKKSEN